MSRSTAIFVSTALAGVTAFGCTTNAKPPPTAADVARICTGIPETQARSVLTDLRGDVDRMESAFESPRSNSTQRAIGVDIHVQATPGMTAQWLARLVECHIVTEAAGGACTTSECPLGLDRVNVGVSTTRTGFTIELRSADAAIARELPRRAKALFESPKSQTVATTP
jgi:hypothetical protein